MEAKKSQSSDVLKGFVKSFGLSRKEENNDIIEQEIIISEEEEQESSPISEPIKSVEIPVVARPTTNPTNMIKKSVAYITSSQVVTGSISLKDDLIIEGIVNGDIDSCGAITIKGSVTGNIKCDKIEIDNSQIKGNIDAKVSAKISNSKVLGDIVSEVVEVNGVVEGNIKASDLCSIMEYAAITGNIVASSIMIKRGSKINGQITTSIPQEG